MSYIICIIVMSYIICIIVMSYIICIIVMSYIICIIIMSYITNQRYGDFFSKRYSNRAKSDPSKTSPAKLNLYIIMLR